MSMERIRVSSGSGGGLPGGSGMRPHHLQVSRLVHTLLCLLWLLTALHLLLAAGMSAAVLVITELHYCILGLT